MLYILETKLRENKPLLFALTSIYGIGLTKARTLCKKLGFSSNLKVKHLTQEQTFDLLKLIDRLGWKINNELRKFESFQIKRLILTRSYRGIRRIKGLPVRGQRTHTNAKSARRVRKLLLI